MHFLYPEFIYLMLFPAALLVYLITTNKDVLERIFDERVLAKLRIDGDALGRHGHNTLLFTVFLLMTLALARPVIDKGEHRVKVPGVDLVVALDLSRSMRAKDFYPDRLRFAKQKLLDLLPRLPVDRVGLVGFTSVSYVAMPLSEDRRSAAFILTHMSEEMIDRQGSRIDAALLGSASLLRKSRERFVLLVTDGGERRRVDRWVALAKKERLHVVVWMMASTEGAPIPLEGGTIAHDENGEPILSRANTSLKRLAHATGGIYVPATLGQRDIERLIGFFRKVSDGRTHVKVVKERIELFYYPLALALLILPFALYSVGAGRKILGITLLVYSSGAIVPAKAGIFDFLQIEQAYQAYEKGEYRKSADLLEKLALHNRSGALWYDLGNSYYKSGRYKMACDAYSRVVTSDRIAEAAKLYNLGNCYVRLGNLEKAMAFYKKSLALKEDADARYNLALVEDALKQRRKSHEQEQSTKRDLARQRSKRNHRSRSPGKPTKQGGRSEATAAKKAAMTPLEERKWMQLIEKSPIQLKLYPLQMGKEPSDEHPW